MAEKKFFVDINLQGSALTNAKIGTNSGIGSTEGAFGYDSASHRLQYFNGTATKDVANLSDISAVTGGLIFQGGYDPTTDTPDITDGSALKGFFWAATAAGTFLGESVQVGDSIVAKVDAAGATIADWLILQGNIVIATDSVDGISRLATQTEANDGTEGGAVVITPATLQGKIDAQITPEINSKLSKSGDTMSGTLNMGDNNIENVNTIISTNVYGDTGLYDHIGGNNQPEIYVDGDLDLQNSSKVTNLPAPTNGGDAANKTYVDDQDALKLSLTGGTMEGAIDMGGNTISGVVNLIGQYVVIDGIEGNTTGTVEFVSDELDFLNNGKVTNLPAPTANGDAANKQYVDGAASTAQANAEAAANAYTDSLAPNYDAAGAAATALTDANAYTDTGLATKLNLAGGTMSGNINMGAQSILDIGTAYVNTLNSPDFTTPINLDINIDAGDANTIINLPAPTDNGDAANKEYVDTEIAAQSFQVALVSGDWTLNGSTYEATVTHNLNSSYPVVTFADGDDTTVELVYTSLGSNLITVKSNILPSNISVSLIAARP